MRTDHTIKNRVPRIFSDATQAQTWIIYEHLFFLLIPITNFRYFASVVINFASLRQLQTQIRVSHF